MMVDDTLLDILKDVDDALTLTMVDDQIDRLMIRQGVRMMLLSMVDGHDTSRVMMLL